MPTLPIVIIAAVADNGVIGNDNRLIWRLRTDLRRFRALTLGRPVLMGRKTFLSIGKPLPGRESVVLTRDSGFSTNGVHVANDLPAALALGRELGAALGADAVMVAGGADLYAQTLPLAARLELTRVHASPPGDVVFPDWDPSDFNLCREDHHPASADDEHAFSFERWGRKSAGSGSTT